MDTERALISKIISTGQLEDAVSKGVRFDLFADDECRDIFGYLTEHTRKYKSPPSVSAVKADRPEFEWEVVQDPLDYLIDKFNTLAKRRMAQDMLIELARYADDPEEGKNIDMHFMEVSRKLATLVPSTQVHKFVGDMHRRIDDYEQKVKDGKHRIGIPFGFSKLDLWTGGIQSHEFVTVSGFSGLGKSTLLMVIAFNAWMQGFTPLYISLEMEASMIARKFDAMAADLDYQAMKQLELPEEQLKNWRQTREDALKRASDIPIIDNIRHCTPDHVFAETIRHRPDLVIIDYLSLMRTARPSRGASMWQSLTEITQDLKQNARTLKVPIVAAAQTNRQGGKEGAELDNMGYAISIVQDSDIVLGLYADDEMKERREMEIRLNKNRDGRLGKFVAKWNHEDLEFRDKTTSDTFARAPQEQKPAERAEAQQNDAPQPQEGGMPDFLRNFQRPSTARSRPGES